MTSHAPKRRVPRQQISFEGEPLRTKQAFKDECDINNIIDRFNTTGVISHVNTRQPKYGDFSGMSDTHYMDSLNTVLAARESFDSLPARVRERFANNPENLLRFLQNPSNKKEAQELGLIAPDAAPQPQTPEPPTPKEPANSPAKG